MLKTFTTHEQREEIVKLSLDGHSDALVAYGADLYKQGMAKGASISVGCFIAGYAGVIAWRVLSDKFKNR